MRGGVTLRLIADDFQDDGGLVGQINRISYCAPDGCPGQWGYIGYGSTRWIGLILSDNREGLLTADGGLTASAFDRRALQ